MAVESSQSHVVYNGTGAAAVGYPIPFAYTDPDHIQVSVQAADAEEATILTAAQYDISADPAAVYTTTAIPNTTKVTIERVVPYTQPTVYPEGGRFLAATHEAALDRLTFQVQQIARAVDQSIRLPLASGAPDVLVPTAGALMGFNDDGDFVHYDSARVRELAQLEGGVDANPMATFADAAARAARVPDYSGQLGTQRDDKTLWISTGLNAGDWIGANLSNGICVVDTETKLLAAVAAGRKAFVRGQVSLTAPLELDVDGAELIGDGRTSGLVLPHNGLTAQIVVKVAAKKITLSGLDITTNHPLTTATGIHDVGVEISDAVDCSGLTIEHCRIHHVARPIARLGQPATPWMTGLRIVHNNLHSCLLDVVFLRYNLKGVWVQQNRMVGKEDADGHTHSENAVWLGNYGDNCHVDFNTILRCGRHAIEYWNSQVSPENTGGNKHCTIIGNHISEMQHVSPGSFGISAFGCGGLTITANIVDGCAISFELYGDKTNIGVTNCFGNISMNHRDQAFSLNGLRYGMLTGNYIFPVHSSYESADTKGIQLINGGSNLTVRGNYMLDAGNRCLFLNGKTLTITGISAAADAVFTLSGTVDVTVNNGWPVGKRVCLRDIAGPTALNDKYYEVTWVSGNQIKLKYASTGAAVDTSAMPAYTSGGVVQERWDGIVIEDNVTYQTKLLGVGYQSPAWMYDFQSLVYRNNTRYLRSGVTIDAPAVTRGKVYIGPAGTDIVDSASTGGGNLALGGTNFDLPSFA